MDRCNGTSVLFNIFLISAAVENYVDFRIFGNSEFRSDGEQEII
jgi:hypothetical protein